jgi:TolB-like protein/Tfp pilus assembly protein PilF
MYDMASLIPGFEYDIFISYRQKDNKHDGWVTDFVGNLKGELESTFKEEISVYFDINPHDGILETHDVDASLKDKLKCLVFIPVISHTYCDPNSFAWEHEFKAFIKQASLDRFGLKVTLHSGNVASRILPVRIHELDPEDREMVENELGGTLRAIDFIYKEPGVNRPLTPADDENKNLCGTKYRNQINKTANAVKDIISSLQPEQPPVFKDKLYKRELWEEPEAKPADAGGVLRKNSVRSLRRVSTLITFLLFLACAYAIFKFSGNTGVFGKQREKSIAVLPFEHFGDDTSRMWLCDALADELISQLFKINELKPRARTSVMRYKGTIKSIPEIGREVDANYIIESSYQVLNDSLRVNVKLINARKDEQLWADIFDRTLNDMYKMQVDIAKQIASTLKTPLSPEEKAKIEKDPTENPEAYMNYISANVQSHDALYYFLVGNRYIDSISFASAIAMYDKAIENDPQFALAYAKRSIARSWGYYTGNLDESHIEKCKADADKAFELDKDLADAQVALGFYYYYCTEDYQKAIAHFRTAEEMDPGNYQPAFYMAMVYRKTGDWKQSQDLIIKAIEKEPQDALALINIGTSFTYMHSFDTAVTFYRKAIDAMPGWSGPYTSLVEVLILKYGNTIEARKVLDTLIARTGERQQSYKILLNIYEGKYRDALKELQSSSDEDFGSRGVRYMTAGLVYRLLNDQATASMYNDSALIVYKQKIIENPNDCYAYSCFGLVYAGSGNVTDALIAGKTAVELASDDALTKSDMIINLGKIYVMTGEFANATRQVNFLLNNPSAFSLNFMKVDPDWKKLAESSEFKTMTGNRTGTR